MFQQVWSKNGKQELGERRKQAALAARAESELDQPHLHTRDSPLGISMLCHMACLGIYFCGLVLFLYFLLFPPPREGADASSCAHKAPETLRCSHRSHFAPLFPWERVSRVGYLQRKWLVQVSHLSPQKLDL